MVIAIVKKVVMLVPSKLIALNKATEKLIGLPEKTDRLFTYTTKIIGASTGSMGMAKGSVDFMEAVVCDDKICATVSIIGVIADGLQIRISFIPGPNVTAVTTTPVLLGSKVFVHCCKNSKLPWGC